MNDKLQRIITNGKSIKKQLSRTKLENGLILAGGDTYVRLQCFQFFVRPRNLKFKIETLKNLDKKR